MPALIAREPPPLRQTATLPGFGVLMNSLTVGVWPGSVVGNTWAAKEPDTRDGVAMLILPCRPVVTCTAERLSHESNPLSICESRCVSWRLPETPHSRQQAAPSGPLTDGISSETKQTCARLGIVPRLVWLVYHGLSASSKPAWGS